ncbi:galactoside O-acetyltransferase [Peribacillus muralis]|uniref:DapH/DapD/GlmU-related protein n=1 Tax=Peribacillus muralis TaxID=264697 RepID=UPI001F4DE65E|nr:DapH/DapD/GlmU-related protein [Peribacillus muralis]MCK1994744.1 sugar O-acetyltransferase [Peribacillus muralis]MCK2015429.1 sugar O-acetyltransferase [Peribacillus muralis]
MTQRERIRKGLLFTDMTEGLPEERLRGKELVYDFNQTRPSEVKKREEIANKLFGRIGKDFWIEPPLHLAYGSNIFVGENFYANFNLTIVDDTTVIIGDNVLFAPNVVISTTGHPVDPDLRNTGQMYAFPVTIEDNVWIGSGVIINPGITIGKNSIIGAGSVVTKDIPPNVIAVGNPCKILREISDRDKKYYYKNLKVESN